ncbi:MAG: phosphate propanoyltransferase [Leptotrichiaceae bacterium]|nr:phosphate propanoyltransferase [Leptotrichiaceae bacterium]MBP6281064.1 phosphate propanoyltransferase [Leptotrichiaceae bacterium]MBP7100912.1 phosphate propanoyltransferase [Leptotrichiaceae bacterium]MBP9629390.1 phosphate propanoyltransferase [Leptotrichiaceae bacterium]
MDRAELERKIREELEKILKEDNNNNEFMVEASGRHVHLSKEHLEQLFGKGYELTIAKELSQPGQYAAKERIRVIGPKGEFSNVVILGPCRDFSQVELSLTDCKDIGIKGVLRESGKIEGTPGILIGVGENYIQLDKGAIVAKRHIHMTPEDAEKLNVKDNELVKVKVSGERPVIFDDVLIRVKSSFRLSMHIDYDEANACGYTSGVKGSIIRE